MRVLPRTVLREVLLLAGFYAAVFLGLILAGAAAPLIKQGAPLGAVLAFLPQQAVLLGMLALPLAMVTSFLACIGRMREDGELTALQAAGVGTWQVARATLPLAIGLAILLGAAAHLWLPRMAANLMSGRKELLSQAIAAQVERRKPIRQDANGILAANAVEEDRLIGVFGVQIGEDGGLAALFAPTARWIVDPGAEDEPVVLGLQLDRAFAIMSEGGAAGRVATAVIPSMSTRLPGDGVKLQDKADALSTGELLTRIRTAPERTMRERRAMRNYERAWHTRLMLPVAVIAFWAFACGLGLAAGRGNRMLAVCLGVVTVVATLFPAMILAKEVGERLTIDAGVWVWPPPILLGAMGAWLLWRHR
jgi:lipopolysaccharide export LptBFGC system permease protein LptF